MTKYIDKSAVVAEIERRIKETESMQPKFDQFWAGQISAFKGILKILDTLEVEEVDEIIKTAEDHAYFAGSENTRKKLIDKACKWWEVELTYPSMTPEEIKWYKNKVRKFRKAMEE